MKAKKKILITGLLGAYGGRELEAAFIAKTFEKKYEVALLSTVNVHPDSDIYAFGFKGKVDSLNELVYKESFWVRTLTKLMYAFRKKIRANHYHISNKLTQRFIDLEAVKHRVIKNHITSFDAIIICAQLHSQQIKTLALSAEEAQIPTIFRTTGTIDLDAVKQPEWLEHITYFIHHSETNAAHLGRLKNPFYSVIDQCAFLEAKLLKLPLVSERITSFLCLGRLDENKNIASAIEAFQKIEGPNLRLSIVGNGHEKKKLHEMASTDNRITFKANIKHDAIVDCYGDHDCLIIASHQESGPLTAIEAMAAGRVIISTQVGAMPARLPDHPFWFDGTSESLQLVMEKAMQQTPEQIKTLARKGRERYRSSFSEAEIKKQYVAVLESFV